MAGFYYVQGVHKWQAEWDTAAFATGTSDWGDNLTGDAKLKAGSPIRVELGLFDDTGTFAMQGFTVVKLQPSKLDRESTYGTLAVSDDGGRPDRGTAEILTPARIYDAGVTFSVKNVNTGIYAVPLGTSPTAEINATGKVVYGYNLRVYGRGAVQRSPSSSRVSTSRASTRARTSPATSGAPAHGHAADHSDCWWWWRWWQAPVTAAQTPRA